jgi:hypothetical protein
MGLEMEYYEYKKNLIDSVRLDAEALETSAAEEYMMRTLSLLREYDEIDDPIILSLEDTKSSNQRIMRIDGYCINESERSLILFISDYHESKIPVNMTIGRVDELYWRMVYFLEEACDGNMAKYAKGEENIISASRYIKSRMNAYDDESSLILKIRLFILTNKELDANMLDKNILISSNTNDGARRAKNKSIKKIKMIEFMNKPLEVCLWPIERLYELESSNRNDPVVIDIINDYDSKGIPCIKGSIGEGLGYNAYIAIIPGKLLADIYIEHGSRVLEGNVRSFLGTSNSKGINNGIKKTINGNPTLFFTYNNGIAVTASRVETIDADGQMKITLIEDFQIINGGQTTATLAEAVLKKTNCDLDGIYVSMKLTEIQDRLSETEDGTRVYDSMIQSIAKYANSQNKVTASDMFSNDPFHLWMERISKKCYAPPVQFPISTGWYYERSRRKYVQEQIKLDKNEIKRFTAKYPRNQIINKEQLAIYLTTTACKPHIVCKGKNWVIKEFGTDIGNQYRSDKSIFNEHYFVKCICSAILFRTVDSYLERNKRNPEFWYKPGGYKSSIVPYSIAKIVSCIPSNMSINWESIWQRQSISKAFMNEIEIVTKMCSDYLTSIQGTIITEHCKKEETWILFRDKFPHRLDSMFISELIPHQLIKEQVNSAKKDQKMTTDLEYISNIYEKGAAYWECLLSEGNKRKLLNRAEQAHMTQAINSIRKGSIPCTATGTVPTRFMEMAKSIISSESKLESEGIYATSEGQVRLIITNYDMK